MYSIYCSFYNQNESDLVALVQVMIIIFGEQPPVYSVAGQPPANPAAVYPGSLAGSIYCLSIYIAL